MQQAHHLKQGAKAAVWGGSRFLLGANQLLEVQTQPWLCHDNGQPSERNMTKDDWIKLAMPASITLLAVSIFTIPFVAKASGMMSVEGTANLGRPILVRMLKPDLGN